jgi:hypothetical protein
VLIPEHFTKQTADISTMDPCIVPSRSFSPIAVEFNVDIIISLPSITEALEHVDAGSDDVIPEELDT